MADGGVWVKVHPDDAGGGAPGAAVIGGATADDPLFPVNTSSFTGDGTNGDAGQAYDVYEFLGSGELVVSEPGFVDALVIGGGGGNGKGASGGGGGAGGFLNVSDYFIFSPDTFTITVGGGGPSNSGSVNHPRLGNSSSVHNLVSPGGVSGTLGSGNGYDGASGGGGGANSSGGGTTAGGTGMPGVGHDGGGGVNNSTRPGGGGGGGGSAGLNATSSKGGQGGAGGESYISGESKFYAGGGGGCEGGVGGVGGGGNQGQSGEANTGGGAGGHKSTAASGGSGIVIVRVKVPTESYPFRSKTTAPRTAHAARIEDGIVRQVIVIPHLDDDDAKITAYCNRIGLPGTWVDTSYTGSRRGKYAGVGDTFVGTKSGGEFVSPVVEEITE